MKTKKLLSLVLLGMLCSIGITWAGEITVTPPALTNITTTYYGLYTMTHSSTAESSGSKISSGAITTGTNGDVITINFATTKSDMYIKSITFNSLSNGTLSSDDGSYNTSTNVFTVSGNKTSVNVVLTSSNNKKGSVKVTNVVINTGDNEVETITFTSFDGDKKTFGFTSSAASSAISSISSNNSNSVSNNILSWSNSRTLVFTSSNKFKYVAFLLNDGKTYTGFSADLGTYSDNYTWTGDTKTVTFTNGTGGGRYIKNIFVITEVPAPGTILFDPASGTTQEVGKSITLSSSNADEIKYQWGDAAVSGTGDWSEATTYNAGVIVPIVPNNVGSDKVLSVWAHNDIGDTYGSATYTIEAAKIKVTLAYATTSATITGNEVLTQPVLNVTGADKATLIAAGALEFTSSDNTVAEVDANGVITTQKYSATPVIITAKIEDNETYSDVSATFTLTINPMTFDAPTITFNGTEYDGSEDITGLTTGAAITINLPSGTSAYGNWSSNKKNNVSDAYPSKAITGTSASTSTGGIRYLYLVAGNEWGYSSIVNFKFTGVVASNPVFNVAGGYLSKDATVNISTLDKNDVVYYTSTNDGSEPANPTQNSTMIVDGSKTNDNLSIFTAVGTYKIKAIAYAKNNADHGSAVVSYTYTVTEDELVSITPSYEKTTYVTSNILDFSEVDGLKAYVATAASAAGVTMTSIDAVPASTPLLLIGAKDITYNIPVAVSASEPATNYLRAGTGAEDWGEIGGANYLLYTDGKFHPISDGTIAVGKAYLHLAETPSSSPELRIIFEEETATNIDDVVATDKAIKFFENGQLLIKRDGVVYDAMGRIVR